MGRSGYLIDSNAVIDYLGNKLSASGMEFMSTIIDDIPNISVITKIEVLGYNAAKEHYRILEAFINDSEVIRLYPEIVEQCIEIRKQYRIKLPDAIIAATALHEQMTLITRNISDFEMIDELEIIDSR